MLAAKASHHAVAAIGTIRNCLAISIEPLTK